MTITYLYTVDKVGSMISKVISLLQVANTVKNDDFHLVFVQKTGFLAFLGDEVNPSYSMIL